MAGGCRGSALDARAGSPGRQGGMVTPSAQGILKLSELDISINNKKEEIAFLLVPSLI